MNIIVAEELPSETYKGIADLFREEEQIYFWIISRCTNAGVLLAGVQMCEAEILIVPEGISDDDLAKLLEGLKGTTTAIWTPDGEAIAALYHKILSVNPRQTEEVNIRQPTTH